MFTKSEMGVGERMEVALGNVDNSKFSNDDERQAMNALLSAHPQWRCRPVSIRMALDHREVPLAVKSRYVEIHNARYPKSTPVSL